MRALIVRRNSSDGFPSTWRCSPIVIPAHAGIQVYSAELTWIPASAGMTDCRRPSFPIAALRRYFRRSTRRTRSSGRHCYFLSLPSWTSCPSWWVTNSG